MESNVVEIADNDSEDDITDCWLKVDGFYLFDSDRMTILDDEAWLNDNHKMCSQLLIKK